MSPTTACWPVTRRELHLRTAEALAELYGDRDDLAATFAYHYARTDLVDEAVRWLIRAADRAARVYANAEAVLHLDLAARRLQRLPEKPDRDRRMLDVALRHAYSLYFLGRFRESVEVLLPHEARLARLNEPALTAAYSFWLAHMHSRLGDQRRACDNAARAIEAATRAGDEATLGKAHGLLVLEGHWSGNTADGISHGRTSLGLLRAHPQQRWWLGMTHFYLAMNHLVQGDFETALAEANRADAVGKEIGDPRLQTYAAFAVGLGRGHTPERCGRCCGMSAQPRAGARSRQSRLCINGAGIRSDRTGRSRPGADNPRTDGCRTGGIRFPAVAWLRCRADGGDIPDRYTTRCRRNPRRARPGRHDTRAILVRCRLCSAIAARIALDRGAWDEATATFDDAARTFERIGAWFEAQQTCDERDRLNGAIRNPR